MHAILPVLLLYVPATHSEQVVPPNGEARLPVQAMHAAEPLVFLNVCLAHTVHAPPFGPVYPASQMQLVKRVLAAAEFELTGHAVQAALPVTVLYLPATHAKQGSPLCPVYPALHKQLL